MEIEEWKPPQRDNDAAILPPPPSKARRIVTCLLAGAALFAVCFAFEARHELAGWYHRPQTVVVIAETESKPASPMPVTPSEVARIKSAPPSETSPRPVQTERKGWMTGEKAPQ